MRGQGRQPFGFEVLNRILSKPDPQEKSTVSHLGYVSPDSSQAHQLLALALFGAHFKRRQKAGPRVFVNPAIGAPSKRTVCVCVCARITGLEDYFALGAPVHPTVFESRIRKMSGFSFGVP